MYKSLATWAASVAFDEGRVEISRVVKRHPKMVVKYNISKWRENLKIPQEQRKMWSETLRVVPEETFYFL